MRDFTTFLLKLPASMRLVLCVAVSVGVHLAAVFGGGLTLPSETTQTDRGLKVTLVSMPAVAVPSVEEPLPDEPELSPPQEEKPPETRAPKPRPKRSVNDTVVPPVKKVATVVEKLPEPVVEQSVPPEAAPASVLQSVDLACAALQREEQGATEEAAVVPERPAVARLASLVTESAVLVDATPRYRSNPLPDYPYLARQRHWEGVVWLLVDVSSEGQVTTLKVAETSGYGVLDKSALKSVQSWLFDPARRLGVAVDSQVKVPVEFRLE